MEQLAQLFQALAEPNRIRIINLLLDTQELCVCDLERVLAIPQTRVSRHLAFLRKAGLVSARREGQWMHYQFVRHGTFPTRFYTEMKAAFAEIPALTTDIQLLHTVAKLVCMPLVPKKSTRTRVNS